MDLFMSADAVMVIYGFTGVEEVTVEVFKVFTEGIGRLFTCSMRVLS